MDATLVLAIAGALLSLTIIRYFHHRLFLPALRYPPGPTPFPIFGNLHQLPAEYQEREFARWGKTYGEIIYAKIFRTPAVIINSLRVAQDLLEKRNAKYSDRPRNVMLVDMLGWDPDVALLRYGSRYRKHRKWIHSAFLDKNSLANYVPMQRKETALLLHSLLEKPDEFVGHVKRFSASIVLTVTYGHSVISIDDDLVKLIDHAMYETVMTGPPGATIVDFLPFLRHMPTWLPGAGWKRHALNTRKLVRETYERPFAMVQAQLAEGRARPSLVANLSEEASKKGILEQEKDDIMGAGAVIYGAGTDTTNTVILTFILLMTIHSNVYHKAQEEIDRVVGSDRLPDLSDRDSLPYLECLLKETYRWNCPVPLGVPHSVMEDDEYRGYYIPKGSIVIANLWNMTQDAEAYSLPEIFRPERFLEMDASMAEIADPRNIIFGHGRRICPGRYFADTSIWLVMARIVSVFDMRPAKDSSGNPIIPVPKFISAFVSHPHEFASSFTPRSDRSIELVEHIRASLG